MYLYKVSMGNDGERAMALRALTEGLKRLGLEDVPRLLFFEYSGHASADEAERQVAASDGGLFARQEDESAWGHYSPTTQTILVKRDLPSWKLHEVVMHELVHHRQTVERGIDWSGSSREEREQEALAATEDAYGYAPVSNGLSWGVAPIPLTHAERQQAERARL